jgi:hypothetical protein
MGSEEVRSRYQSGGTNGCPASSRRSPMSLSIRSLSSRSSRRERACWRHRRIAATIRRTIPSRSTSGLSVRNGTASGNCPSGLPQSVDPCGTTRSKLRADTGQTVSGSVAAGRKGLEVVAIKGTALQLASRRRVGEETPYPPCGFTFIAASPKMRKQVRRWPRRKSEPVPRFGCALRSRRI